MVIKCRIKVLRAELDMTQAKLSDLTGIAVSMISAYENNHRIPNAITLWSLADALQCKVDDLYRRVI